MSHTFFAPKQGQRVPVRVWARAPSTETIWQLQQIASRSYVVDHVAAMADTHLAEGVAVGTVFATDRVVVPAALGSDLGCGMRAVKLSSCDGLPNKRELERFLELLERVVPCGATSLRKRGIPIPDTVANGSLSTQTLEHSRQAIVDRHLGTLGGGNHFLELDRDAQNDLWLVVHSGSRGLGAALAVHHTKVAKASGDSLGGLDVETDQGRAFLSDSDYALLFARENRRVIAERALEALSEVTGLELAIVDTVDLPHNFVAQEKWLDRDLYVHRKGAVAAPAGARGLVPGSMGTATYLVEGLGNPLSFGSCSHGAGRVLSRSEARRKLGKRGWQASLARVVWPQHRSRSLVEEAPQAYRDIREVLEDQEDLVERRVRLEPLAVFKG